MTFTKVRGRGVTTTDNYTVGVITATKFVGPITGGGGDIQVGVLTTTQLDLNGNGDVSGNLVVHGNLTANGDFTTLNTTLREVELLHVDTNSSATAGIITQRGSGDILNLFDNNTEVVTVKDGGHFGIGTVTPYYPLDVRFGSSTTALSGGSSGNWGGLGLRLQNNNTTVGSMSLIHFRTGNHADWHIGTKFVGSNDSDIVFLQEGVNEKLRIKNDGRVGIGSDAPTNSLDINAAAGVGIRLRNATTNNSVYFTSEASDKIQFNVGGGTGSYGWITAGTEKLTLTTAGNLGINTTVPAEKLSVAVPGNQRQNIAKFEHYGQQNFFIQGQWGSTDIGGANGTLLYGSGTVALRAATSGNAHLVNLANGKIGIGSLTPAHPLDVFGNIRSHQTTPSLYLQTTGQTTGSAVIRFGDAGSFQVGSIQYDYSGNNHLRFKMGGAGNNVEKLVLEGTTGHITPGTANAQDLGSATKEFRHLYLGDAGKVYFGLDQDMTMTFDSSNAAIELNTGTFSIINYANNEDVKILSDNGSGGVANYFVADGSTGETLLHHYGSQKFATSTTGISVTGEVAASQDYPNFRPTVDWNFAAVKKLDSRITYSRTGPASYVDENGLVKFVGANTPRFDHDPTTRESKGLLIEESRTNVFASSDPGSSAWNIDGDGTKDVNTTETKDPAGTYTACKLMSSDAANSYSQIFDTLGLGTGGMQSFWAKKGTHNVIGIFDYSGGSGVRGWFDLNTGEHRCEGGSKVAAGVQSNGNDTNNTNMVEYPNGWYRCIYYQSKHMTYNHTRIVDFDSDREAAASSNSIYIWGMQAEAGGKTFATSLIPCDTGLMPGTISRGTDFAYIDGTTGTEFDDIYRTDEGTFVLDWFNNPAGNHNDGYVFTVDDGSGNNRIGAVNSNSYQVTVTSGGSSQGNRDLGSINSGANKMAFTYKLNDQATSLNGSDASVDTSCTLPTGLKYWWFGLRQGQYDMLGGYISRIIYYPTRLPNNQLKTLSS